MSSAPPTLPRSQSAKPDEKGRPTYGWALTGSSITDVVKLIMKLEVLPVIFVPGIMGSNLRSKRDKTKVWRLDASLGQPLGLAWAMSKASAGVRQTRMHPSRTEVDPDGAIPNGLRTVSDKDIRARGWGQVGQTSYSAFLQWLEDTLNPREHNPAMWGQYWQEQQSISAARRPGEQPKLFPGMPMGTQGQPFHAEMPFHHLMSDDLIKRSKFWMPVHAVGYNWLASNQEAAESTLKPAIERIINENNRGAFTCRQVILVTHSMGGLVARACAKIPGMEEKIAGVVHGVMPATGAAVAYRRCKIGMKDEDFGAAIVIGKTGKEVTAVFSQAPGALQLLPSNEYRAGWLGVQQGAASHSWPRHDPYEEIYKVRDKWWGLVNELWLKPTGGTPIEWNEFENNVNLAQSFHAHLSGKYHAATYVFYGADKKQMSFERVNWQLKKGLAPDAKPAPSLQQVTNMSGRVVRLEGSSPEYVGGEHHVDWIPTPGGSFVSEYDTSYWELHCEMQDGVGDGTVPAGSGRSPREKGGASIKQQFKLTGFAHEPAYKNDTARLATVYAITKIAGSAKTGP